MATQRRVAVIGAGMSGLVTARALQDEGIEPVVFEQTTNIGGLWNYRDDAPNGGGPAYRSLRTNTSRQVMAFSDFPMDAHLPDFPARADVLAYLHTYTHNHRLLDHVRLGVRVERATPVGDGRWDIVVRTAVSGKEDDASGSGMERLIERFDGLVVCTGREGAPLMPTYPGMETFTGTLTHSAAYTSPESYADRDVVVVGAGSSAADIAVEVASVARRVLMSTSHGAWYVPRVIGGRPYDHQLTRLSAHVPYGLRMRAFRALVLREYADLGVTSHALRDHGLPEPPFDIWRARIVASTDSSPQLRPGGLGCGHRSSSLTGPTRSSPTANARRRTSSWRARAIRSHSPSWTRRSLRCAHTRLSSTAMSSTPTSRGWRLWGSAPWQDRSSLSPNCRRAGSRVSSRVGDHCPPLPKCSLRSRSEKPGQVA